MTFPATVAGMDALDQLRRDTATMQRLSGRRDDLIVQARRAGVTWRAIADAAGLTELAVRKAARRANGGVLPVPDREGAGR